VIALDLALGLRMIRGTPRVPDAPVVEVLGPENVVIDSQGDFLIADPASNFGKIIRVDALTGAQTIVAQPGISGDDFKFPRGIAIAAAGDLIVTGLTNAGASGVFRVDPIDGSQSIIATGGFLFQPQGLAIDDDGDLIVAGGNRLLIRIDPVTGQQSVISSSGLFSIP
jgi:hypothetical protein